MVTLGEVSELITALAALGALVTSLRNKQAIHEVHLTMNSRLTELIKLTGEAEHAKGVKQEQDKIANREE